MRLAEVMRKLRAPDGCPWDKEQDLRTLRPYLIEEAYEVLEEMDAVTAGGPWAPFKEELGDLLFQIVFHSQLAAEKGEFDLGDVADAIAEKLTRRHPHVFGERAVQVSGATQVLENWAKLKAKEREAKQGRAGSVLDGVPVALPALQRSERLTEKASRIGFDWPDLKSVRAKVTEELAELDEAIASGKRQAIEAELGDTLFALANLARHARVAPEDALRGTIARFIARFHYVEAGLAAQGIAFGEGTLAQMDALWNEAKAQERKAQQP
jgi:nucleoside triphosphate diphosphatase